MNEKKIAIRALNPYLTVKGGAEAIEFYKNAFDAELLDCCKSPDGLIMHAQLKVGASLFMLSDEYPEPQGCGMKAPLTLKGSSVMLQLECTDVDYSFKKAVKAGAKVVMPIENQFWGERYGQIEDPFGHRWSLSMLVEKLTRAEINERAKAFCK